jgi:hypothetical protein
MSTELNIPKNSTGAMFPALNAGYGFGESSSQLNFLIRRTLTAYTMPASNPAEIARTAMNIVKHVQNG